MKGPRVTSYGGFAIRRVGTNVALEFSARFVTNGVPLHVALIRSSEIALATICFLIF